MSYYDPSPWITDGDDGIIEGCETVLQYKKKAFQNKISHQGKSFIPGLTIEWDVDVVETGDTMRLTLWRDTRKKIDINLVQKPKYLRKGHFNYPPQRIHTNPDKKIIASPNHVHFPTVKYPSLDLESSKYCYPVTVFPNYIEALQLFCDHNNIVVRTSLPLVI